MSSELSFSCRNCSKSFTTSKGLSLHLHHNLQCRQSYVSLTHTTDTILNDLHPNKRLKHDHRESNNDNSPSTNSTPDYNVNDIESDNENKQSFFFCNDSRVEVNLLK